MQVLQPIKKKFVLLGAFWLSISSIFFSTACDHTTNKIHEVSLQCGSDFLIDGSDSRVVKLVNSDENDLTGSAVSVKAFDGSGNEIATPISSRGCILLTNRIETLRARSSANGQTVGLAFERKNISSDKFSKIKMNRIPEIKASFWSCPDKVECFLKPLRAASSRPHNRRDSNYQ